MVPDYQCVHWFSRTKQANDNTVKVDICYSKITFVKACASHDLINLFCLSCLHCGHTRRDRVRNEVIRDRVGVAPIEEKLTQHRLRWFGHVQRRPPETPVRSGVLERIDNVKRGRGRPKLTWDESVKRDEE